MKKLVYIAHPYAHPDPVENTNNVIKIAEVLLRLGYIPYVPHLTLLWHIVSPHPIDFWYDYDLNILERCDYILRLGGKSKGGDNEVKFAKKRNIPVCFSIRELMEKTR